MAQAMFPPMTDGQIDAAVGTLRDVLNKHRLELLTDVAHQVLGDPALGRRLLYLFRKMIEEANGTTIRYVEVDFARTAQQAIDAVSPYGVVQSDVAEAMPRGQNKKEYVHFFWIDVDRFLKDDEIEREYEMRGLVPVDPYTLAAVNECDSTFVDEHINYTHWKDAGGNWCYFVCWRDQASYYHGFRRFVNISRRDGMSYSGVWFAGVHKQVA